MTRGFSRLETRLFRAYWDDGLIDLFFGVGVVLIGLCWALDLVAIGAVVPAILFPFWTPLRRSLIEARAGVVEFSRERDENTRRKLRLALGLGVLSFVVALLIFWLTTPGRVSVLADFIAGLPAMLLGFLAALLAAGLGLPRFMGYAMVLVACGVVVGKLDQAPEVAMISGGVAAALGGAWLLSRFLRGDVEEGSEESR